MRSEVAWAVASTRVGGFFDLVDEVAAADGESAEAGLGYEQLRTFTTGVQVVGAAQQVLRFARMSDGARRISGSCTTAPGSVGCACFQDEFFATPPEETAQSHGSDGSDEAQDGSADIAAGSTASSAVEALPIASFVRFNTAALQAKSTHFSRCTLRAHSLSVHAAVHSV